mmetsp:Transcript_42540/g.77247  ORF Transcript_42540/g.77247 Transcript_42540/m.77247 type:complete len:299 (+) Transcript_42540:64-960(+)
MNHDNQRCTKCWLGNEAGAGVEDVEALTWKAIGSAPLSAELLHEHQVVIFGDSWAEDQSETTTGLFAGVQGWPVHLAGMMKLPVAGNFAKGRSETPSLAGQLSAAKAALGTSPALWEKLVVILHAGGNDFIGAEKHYNPFATGNFWFAHCTWGFTKKATEVIENLKSFLEELCTLGARCFIVSDMPFSSAVPILTLAKVGHVDRRGRWLSHRMHDMLSRFEAERADGGRLLHVVRIPEVHILTLLKTLSASRKPGAAFLKDRFHPTQEMHARMAEVIACHLQQTRPEERAEGQLLLAS